MFGALRTALALMVMSQHLLNLVPLGKYAVFLFYIISGYLMTLIMHQTYGYSLKGQLQFLLNRILRLYPVYWVVIAATYLFIYYLGEDMTRNYNRSLYLPTSLAEIIGNITMIFWSWSPVHVYPRLSPATWALTIEIFFYIMICLGLSRTLNRIRIWFFFSVLYVFVTWFLQWDIRERYFPILAASLPFSIGSSIYFYAKTPPYGIPFLSKVKISASWLFLLLLINALIGFYFYTRLKIGFLNELVFYINLILASWLVYKIALGETVFPIRPTLDKFLGDFSYPIYLMHWQVGLLVSYTLFGSPTHRFNMRLVENFFVSLVVVFLFSFLLTELVDKPIQKYRAKIRAFK